MMDDDDESLAFCFCVRETISPKVGFAIVCQIPRPILYPPNRVLKSRVSVDLTA